MWPESRIISLYVSPKIGLYKIDSVTLMPLIPDDTTDSGTFYSTNHFINLLEKKYPAIKFVVQELDSVAAHDTLAVSNIVASIEKKKKLDLKKFFMSDLGYEVWNDTTDAMILGIIDSCSRKQGFYIADNYLDRIRLTSCNFTYYLISLSDGRVLWKAQLLGERGYLGLMNELYPPLDYAVSSGIDQLIKKIPLD